MTQNSGSRLVTAFQKQTEKVSYFCAAENVSPNLAVHEIRKSFKRMRSLLHFYSDLPDNFYSYFSTQMRNFGLFLSPIRESFVNIQIFERIATSQNLVAEKKMREAREWLLESNRELLETKFSENNGCLVIHEFINAFEAQLDQIEKDRPSQHQMVHQLILSYQGAYDFFQRIEIDSDPEYIHNLRKKLKRIWYQFDFIKFMHPRYFKSKSDQLNKITEQLGEDHDMQVFIIDFKKSETGFDESETAIIENQIQHLRELNLLKLSPRLKQFFNDPPEVFNKKMEDIFKIKID